MAIHWEPSKHTMTKREKDILGNVILAVIWLLCGVALLGWAASSLAN